MDYRKLINKLDQISEAEVAIDPNTEAQYRQIQAKDAKANAVAQVKKLMAIPLNQIPRLGDAIDPKTGIIYYGEADGLDANIGKPRKMPYDWMMRGSNTDTGKLAQLLKTAGLEVVPHEEKTLFGTAKYAKVDPAKLATIDNPAPEQTTTTTPATNSSTDLATLNDLVAKLQAAHAPHVKKESVDYNFAAALTESFGYIVEADPGFAGTVSKGGWVPPKLPSTNATSTISDYGSVGKAAAERRAAAEAARLAAQKTAQQAAPAVAKTATTVANAAADAAPTVAKGVAKAGGKLAARALPGVGLALGTYDAYNRIKQGDYTGAAIDALGGVAGLVPGVGTAAQLGLMGVQAGRDKMRTGSYLPSDEEIKAAANGQPAPTTQAAQQQPQQAGLPGGDSKIKAMQAELKAAGANLGNFGPKGDGIDGKIGNVTKAALAKYPQIAKKYGMVAESVLAENLVTDAIKLLARGGSGAMKGGSNLIKGAQAAAKGGAEYKAAVRAGGATKAGAKINKAVLQNPVKTGLGTIAAGTLAGKALTNPVAPAPAPAPVTPPGPRPNVRPPSPEQGGLPEGDDEKQLILKIKDLMIKLDSAKTDPAVAKALTDAQTAIDTVEKGHAAPKPAAQPPKAEQGALPAKSNGEAANAFDIQRGK